jgi:HSP20 family molecular chaperone IbpA
VPNIASKYFLTSGLSWKAKLKSIFELEPAPVFRWEQTESLYELHAWLPGIEKEELRLHFLGLSVYLHGPLRVKFSDQGFLSYTRIKQFFQRIRVPSDLDTKRVEGSLENGYLKLKFPRGRPALLPAPVKTNSQR